MSVDSDYKRGTVLAFQYKSNEWGVLIVAEGEFFDKEIFFNFIQTTIKKADKPTMQDVLKSNIIDPCFHNFEYKWKTSQSGYYAFVHCFGNDLKSKSIKLFNEYNSEFFVIIGNLPEWKDCISGSVVRGSRSIISYNEHKTYEEFKVSLIKELDEKFKQEKSVTKMTVAEINEEFLTTDINRLTEKWYISKMPEKIIEAVEALQKSEQTTKLLTELTRAYHATRDEKRLKKAVKIIEGLKGDITDLNYSYLLGYTHYCLTEFEKALVLFNIALPLDTNYYYNISKCIEECKHFIKHPYIFEVYQKINKLTKVTPKDISINKDIELIGKNIKTESEKNIMFSLLIRLVENGQINENQACLYCTYELSEN